MSIKCFMVEPTDGGWRVVDTGEIIPRHLPAGAMYFANQEWAESVGNLGPDGKSLFIQTPSGPWHIDGRASNCTRRGEVHHCWVRHGEPPNVTVDKDGETCGCGCSIAIDTYHGFLRNGHLEDA